MSGAWVMAAALLSSLAIGAAPTTPTGDLVTVAPGSVVRWPGQALLSCELGGRRWQPLGEACYYPIDLGAAGTLELVRRSTAGVASRRVMVGSYPYPTEELEVEEKYVAPSQAELARIEREKRRVAELWEMETPRRFSLPLASPLTTLPQLSRFGARRIFNRQPRSPHSGADFSAAPGTPVFAAADGRVVLAEEHFFAGRAVFIDHGDGLISMAFHLAEIRVHAGKEVRRGEEIGRVGATGRVTGPHLHFGLRWHGARVDPALLLGRAQPLEVR